MNTFDTNYGKLTISFPEFNAEEYIKEAVWGEERLKIRRWAAALSNREVVCDDEGVPVDTKVGPRSEDEVEESWKRLARHEEGKLKRDLGVDPPNPGLQDPIQRLTVNVLWYLNNDSDKTAEMGESYISHLGPVRLELLRVLHLLRAIARDCMEQGIRGKDHPLAPKAFYMVWEIYHTDYHQALVKGDPGFDFHKGLEREEDYPWFDEDDPIYLNYELPGELTSAASLWGDVEFELLCSDGSVRGGSCRGEHHDGVAEDKLKEFQR